jgi:hypothetical protein
VHLLKNYDLVDACCNFEKKILNPLKEVNN